MALEEKPARCLKLLCDSGHHTTRKEITNWRERRDRDARAALMLPIDTAELEALIESGAAGSGGDAAVADRKRREASERAEKANGTWISDWTLRLVAELDGRGDGKLHGKGGARGAGADATNSVLSLREAQADRRLVTNYDDPGISCDAEMCDGEMSMHGTGKPPAQELAACERRAAGGAII
eukprot:6308773-Prymnesium_polylepis.1